MKHSAAQLVTAAVTASFGKRLPETAEAVTCSPEVEGWICVSGNRSNRSNRFYAQGYSYMCVAWVRKIYVYSLPYDHAFTHRPFPIFQNAVTTVTAVTACHNGKHGGARWGENRL